MGASARGKLMVKLADIIDREAEMLGRLEVQDNGKLLAEMGSQTRYIGEWYRYFGGLADKIEGTVIPTDKANMFNFTRYEPYGVVGLITPWNSPLLLVAYKLAPALAAVFDLCSSNVCLSVSRNTCPISSDKLRRVRARTNLSREWSERNRASVT